MSEVRPFLDNVLLGRAVPAERMEEVVRHYEQIGGRSPLNELTFRQAEALRTELQGRGVGLPVYVGMRNWTPYLHETLAQMAADGVRRAVGVIMSAQQSDAGWHRYVRDVDAAREQVVAAPQIDFAAEWHAHPQFIAAVADRVATALATIPSDRRADTPIIFTAHSIPAAAPGTAGYVEQVRQAAALVSASLGRARWSIAYQSRSGNPHEPWLEPDICEVMRQLARDGVQDIAIVPIGFVCDHVEVLYDLDTEARQVAVDLGLNFVRAAAVNDHPLFIRMLADVVCTATAKPIGSSAPHG